MTEQRRPKRVGPRRLRERREGSIRCGDRRAQHIQVDTDRRSGLERRDNERRTADERRSCKDRRRKAK